MIWKYILKQIINLTQLIFGFKFNQPLNNSLSNLTNLTYLGFGFNFNQPLELSSNIKILSIDFDNFSLIENLPNSVEELYIGEKFKI